MTPDQVKRIKENPKFEQLVKKRRATSTLLAVIMLALYFSFIMLIAFSPETLAAKLGGSVMTVGIAAGVGIIVIAFILTGIYTNRANKTFDTLINEIKKETGEGS
jgi:uncharacterized membrane protein (DUF485 family)